MKTMIRITFCTKCIKMSYVLYKRCKINSYLHKNKKKALVGLAHRGFRTEIGDLELLLEFNLSLARAFSSDTSLLLTALIPFFPLFKLLFLGFNYIESIIFRFFPKLVLPVDARCQIS